MRDSDIQIVSPNKPLKFLVTSGLSQELPAPAASAVDEGGAGAALTPEQQMQTKFCNALGVQPFFDASHINSMQILASNKHVKAEEGGLKPPMLSDYNNMLLLLPSNITNADFLKRFGQLVGCVGEFKPGTHLHVLIVGDNAEVSERRIKEYFYSDLYKRNDSFYNSVFFHGLAASELDNVFLADSLRAKFEAISREKIITDLENKQFPEDPNKIWLVGMSELNEYFKDWHTKIKATYDASPEGYLVENDSLNLPADKLFSQWVKLAVVLFQYQLPEHYLEGGQVALRNRIIQTLAGKKVHDFLHLNMLPSACFALAKSGDVPDYSADLPGQEKMIHYLYKRHSRSTGLNDCDFRKLKEFEKLQVQAVNYGLLQVLGNDTMLITISPLHLQVLKTIGFPDLNNVDFHEWKVVRKAFKEILNTLSQGNDFKHGFLQDPVVLTDTIGQLDERVNESSLVVEGDGDTTFAPKLKKLIDAFQAIDSDRINAVMKTSDKDDIATVKMGLIRASWRNIQEQFTLAKKINRDFSSINKRKANNWKAREAEGDQTKEADLQTLRGYLNTDTVLGQDIAKLPKYYSGRIQGLLTKIESSSLIEGVGAFAAAKKDGPADNHPASGNSTSSGVWFSWS